MVLLQVLDLDWPQFFGFRRFRRFVGFVGSVGSVGSVGFVFAWIRDFDRKVGVSHGGARRGNRCLEGSEIGRLDERGLHCCCVF